MTQNPTTAINIVWLKRDLRLFDHAPLRAASQAGAFMLLYCWEPAQWQGNDYAAQHQAFIEESLQALRTELAFMGGSLTVSAVGIVETLTMIRQQRAIAGLFSHEETGNGASFVVDKAVAKWCEYHHVTWQEYAQNGVVRRLKNRNQWAKGWEERMRVTPLQIPTSWQACQTVSLPSQAKIAAKGLDKPKRQRGGRARGLSILEDFLAGRAARYRGGISSPLSAVTAGSRLSPYLAYGALSMREVVQDSRAKRAELPQDSTYARLHAGLLGFESRLHWHCHFMQKLESEPAIEFDNMHRAHDGMRDQHLADVESQRRLQAWAAGQTGWPLVDACMAMLRATGWLNFRMRAMLMSTASYLYWLHWRETGLHLAREFLDYEPGIHWAQTQMQSGTTGINTLRIYHPIKQAEAQDPTGAFVRHWLPQLKNVPNTWIFEPYLMPKHLQLQYQCVLEKDYPLPIVDITQAMRYAKQAIASARSHPSAYNETRQVVQKHASRKGGFGQKSRQAAAKSAVKNHQLAAQTAQRDFFAED